MSADLDKPLYELMNEALTQACEEAFERGLDLPLRGATIMAFKIFAAVDQGERDSDRLAELALQAFDETTIH